MKNLSRLGSLVIVLASITALALSLWSWELSVERLEAAKFDVCMRLMTLRSLTDEEAAAYEIEDLVACKDVLDPARFQTVLDHLTDVGRGAKFLALIMDTPFYVYYGDIRIDAIREEERVTEENGHEYTEVFYYLLTDNLGIAHDELTGLALLDCGEPLPQVSEHTLVIYPCPYK